MKEKSYINTQKDLAFPAILDRRRDLNNETSSNKKIRNHPIKYLTDFFDIWHYKSVSPTVTPNTPIFEVLEKDKKKLALSLIKQVLSEELDIPNPSEELEMVVKQSGKIFHEDYPGDFILEYAGNRLGLFLLDVCYDSRNNANPVYRYRPNLTSFAGLF